MKCNNVPTEKRKKELIERAMSDSGGFTERPHPYSGYECFLNHLTFEKFLKELEEEPVVPLECFDILQSGLSRTWGQSSNEQHNEYFRRIDVLRGRKSGNVAVVVGMLAKLGAETFGEILEVEDMKRKKGFILWVKIEERLYSIIEVGTDKSNHYVGVQSSYHPPPKGAFVLEVRKQV